jgi:Tn3 transposase DDE domain
LHLVANAAIYQNVVDMSRVLDKLVKEGLKFGEAELMALSPYITHHIKRFGDYTLNFNQAPEAFDGKLNWHNLNQTTQTVS